MLVRLILIFNHYLFVASLNHVQTWIQINLGYESLIDRKGQKKQFDESIGFNDLIL